LGRRGFGDGGFVGQEEIPSVQVDQLIAEDLKGGFAGIGIGGRRSLKGGDNWNPALEGGGSEGEGVWIELGGGLLGEGMGFLKVAGLGEGADEVAVKEGLQFGMELELGGSAIELVESFSRILAVEMGLGLPEGIDGLPVVEGGGEGGDDGEPDQTDDNRHDDPGETGWRAGV